MTDDFKLPPLPWRHSQDGRFVDANGCFIGVVTLFDKTDKEDCEVARYIVATMNAHPAPPTLAGLLAEAHALVAELRAVVEAARARPQTPGGMGCIPAGEDMAQYLGITDKQEDKP